MTRSIFNYSGGPRPFNQRILTHTYPSLTPFSGKRPTPWTTSRRTWPRGVEAGAHPAALSEILYDPIYELGRRHSWLSAPTVPASRDVPFSGIYTISRVVQPAHFDARLASASGGSREISLGTWRRSSTDCFDRSFQDGILIQEDPRKYAANRRHRYRVRASPAARQFSFSAVAPLHDSLVT